MSLLFWISISYVGLGLINAAYFVLVYNSDSLQGAAWTILSGFFWPLVLVILIPVAILSEIVDAVTGKSSTR